VPIPVLEAELEPEPEPIDDDAPWKETQTSEQRGEEPNGRRGTTDSVPNGVRI
jgi:hypothetical protein